MLPVTIRLHAVGPDGRVFDTRRQLSIEQCGGVVPVIGDEIMLPLGVGESLEDAHRHMVRVLRRVFSPRDVSDIVALVVERRPVGAEDDDLLP